MSVGANQFVGHPRPKAREAVTPTAGRSASGARSTPDATSSRRSHGRSVRTANATDAAAQKRQPAIKAPKNNR